MEIVGRLTTDAKVNETKNGIRVVNFSLAVNDRFKTGSGEIKEQVTFFNCSYWMSSGIAEHLLKGSLVEVSGRVSANAWVNAEGEAKASLNFHVDRIKLHGKANGGNAGEANTEPAADETPF